LKKITPVEVRTDRNSSQVENDLRWPRWEK